MAAPIISKAILLFIIVLCEFILCKKLRTPDFDPHKLGSDKLNECRRCKLLTDSFNYWLEKTSRGKYDGGDAAWEEAKLKSYTRSEIRLVEVQEGVCSEVKRYQDDCYALAEEAEQMLEKWWFQEDSNSRDLHTWLCIENYKYCCPTNHFGENCIPCLIDKDNKVCSGRGTCDGDSTRNGNGTCICRRGYSGKYCNECAKDFYSISTESCKQCHMACSGCSGDGPSACDACKSGWQLDSGVCIDINECLQSTCKSNQFCVNREGTYSCRGCDQSCSTCVGEGPTNCTSCDPKNILLSGMCIDDVKRNDIIASTIKRIALYMGLLIITFFTYRFSKTLASLNIIIFAVFMYFSEKSIQFNIFDVIRNVYLDKI